VRFLLAAINILLLSACLSQPDCLVTATNIVKISLKKANSDSINSVTFAVIRVSGTDTLFYTNQETSSLNLPVHPGTLETTFTFEYYAKVDTTTVLKKDSVTLAYVPLYFVISPDCGGYVYLTNLSVSSYSFANEPIVLNPQLLTSATTNLQIKL
jgi:hypothetical protein